MFGYAVWGMLLNRYPAGTVSAFSLLIPVAGLVSAALLLGETVSPLEIAGSLLVLAGLSINVLGPRIRSARLGRERAV